MVNVSDCNRTTIFDVKRGYLFNILINSLSFNLFNIFLKDDHYNLEKVTEEEPIQGKIPINFEIPIECVAAVKYSGKRSYSTTPNLNRKKSTNFSKLK